MKHLKKIFQGSPNAIAPVVLVALGALATLGACADQVTFVGADSIDVSFADGGTADTSGTDAPRPDTDAGPGTDIKDPPDVAPTEAPQLSFSWLVGDDDISCENAVRCAVSLSYNGDRNLEVRYHRGDLNLSTQPVNWTIESDPNQLGTVASSISYTSTEGIASVLTQPSFALIGSYTVKASVDNPAVAPIYFDVTISPKGIVPLTVATTYAESGLQNLTQYEVRLYRQTAQGGTPNCNDIEAVYLLQAEQQGPPTLMGQTTKFPVFANLETEGVQHYAVLAYALDNSNNVLAWGCNDSDADVTFGQARTVSVELKDVPPTYKGTYTVQSYFDFVTALPESVQPYIYGILDIFESPVGGLLKLTCTIGGSALDDFCDIVFQDVNNPSIDDLTVIGGIAVDLINSIIQGFASGTVWGDILAGGQDIGQMLQNFEIRAEIRFDEQPDENGHWSADMTYENWTTVVVKWSIGQNCDPFSDPNCGKQTFSVADIQSNLVEGGFTADVTDFWNLTIDAHPLNLKYGALLNWIIEKQMLKLLIPSEPGEPVIDEYEEFIQALLAGKECLDPGSFGMTCCAKFADDLVGQGAIIGASTVEGLCDSLVSLGANFLRQQLLNLDTSTGSVMQIGTMEPCKFYDSDDDRVVDGFGTESAPCKWQVDLNILGATTQIESDFWAVRF